MSVSFEKIKHSYSYIDHQHVFQHWLVYEGMTYLITVYELIIGQLWNFSSIWSVCLGVRRKKK